MTQAPWLKFFVSDWLSSVKISTMSPAEEGAYIRLLCYCWNNPDCTISDDDDQLAVLSRLGPGWFEGSSTKLRACFTKHPRKLGRLINARLFMEFKLLQKTLREKKRAGRLGGVRSGVSRRQISAKGGDKTEANRKHTFDFASSRTQVKRSSLEPEPESDNTGGRERASDESRPAPTSVSLEKIPERDRKCGLPAHFQPDEKAIALAKAMKLNPFALAAAFRDHHTSEGTMAVNWQAKFRGWVRKEPRFNGR